jgi:hypothetical protein
MKKFSFLFIISIGIILMIFFVRQIKTPPSVLHQTSVLESTSPSVIQQNLPEEFALIDHTDEKALGALWIVNPEKPNEPIKMITNLSVFANHTYILVDKRIYFIDESTQQMAWMDFDGIVHPLDFTKIADGENEQTSITSFVLDLDHSQIAWATVTSKGQNNVIKTIWVSDLQGMKKQEIFKQEGDQEDYLLLKRFGNWKDEPVIYFQEAHGGMGGYILVPVSWNLKMINLQTRNVIVVADVSDDINSDGMLSVSFKDRQMILHSVKTGSDQFVDLPLDSSEIYGYGGAGAAKFSPSGRFIAFMITQGDPDTGERYRVMIYDFVDESLKTLTDEQGIAYKQFDHWLSDDVLLLRGSDSFWTIHADGTDLIQMK